MSKQQQIQRPKPINRESEPTDAPTVNAKISKLWFTEGH